MTVLLLTVLELVLRANLRGSQISATAMRSVLLAFMLGAVALPLCLLRLFRVPE